MAVKQTFERRDPAKLTNHFANIKIYGGKGPSQEFIDSCKDGIETPLLILPDGTVISGHSRRVAANFWKHKEVPVIVRYDLADDPLEAEKVLILCNGQREKTKDQIAREAARLMEIHQEQAAVRQEKTKAKPGAKVADDKVVALAPPPTNSEKTGVFGKARDKVAEELGVSSHTAEKAANVGQAIMDAEAAGDTEKARELTETVNEKGFAAADRKVKEESAPPPADPKDEAGTVIPKKLRDVFEQRPTFLKLSKQIASVKAAAQKLSDTDAGAFLRFNTVKADLDNAARHLRGSAPYAVCPYCKASGRKGSGDCTACKGIGWVNEGIFKQAPEDQS